MNFYDDKDFLNQLQRHHLKETFARITVLDWNENPIKDVTGVITAGSLSIDGDSTMRRTGSLSIYANNIDNNLSDIESDFSINKKIKLELGLRNFIKGYQGIYDDIVYFNLGIFIMFDPNLQHNNLGVTINVNFKDKMCLLNGEAGGVIPASTDLGQTEYYDEAGNLQLSTATLSQIIFEVLHHFGGEDPAKIIISDLDETTFAIVANSSNVPFYVVGGTSVEDAGMIFVDYNKAVERAEETGQSLKIIKIGEDAGYRRVPFVYPQEEFVVDAGTTVTSVLDKIVEVIGNYEYFYDVDGFFHFQQIKDYTMTTYTTSMARESVLRDGTIQYGVDFAGGEIGYEFTDFEMINGLSNSPSYSNIKNDFLVWGTQSNTEWPLRYHVVIDDVPETGLQAYYRTGTPITHQVALYQDAVGVVRGRISSSGGTGVYTMISRDYREEMYYQALEGLLLGQPASPYDAEIIEEFPKVYELGVVKYSTDTPFPNARSGTWKEEYWNAGGNMTWFFDVISPNTEKGKFSVANIGRRQVTVTEDDINCIFAVDPPELVYYKADDWDTMTEQEKVEAYYLNLPKKIVLVDEGLWACLQEYGGGQNDAYSRAKELLYTYTNMNENISIDVRPLYWLEPHTIITLRDDSIGIDGSFLIDSLTMPLSAGEMMSISGHKIYKRE